MKASALAAIIAIVALASCAHLRAPDPHRTGVFVVDGYIVVNQDPIIIPKGDTAAIVWHLPIGSAYRFAENGITVADAGDEFRCAREGETTFVCQNRHSRPGHYKYTIRLEGGDKAPEPLDPFMYNQ